MKISKIINTAFYIIFLCFTIGIIVFIYSSQNEYKIDKDFIELPLKFNHYDSSSAYEMEDAEIIAYGGFVKGIQKNKNDIDSIVIRALSPLPSVTVYGKENASVSLIIENVRPDFYAKSISESNLKVEKIANNTLKINITLNEAEVTKIQPIEPESMNGYSYIILGDNRDGYSTFEEIISQVNGIEPVFVINNGDLVYSGKANQYRLFDKMASEISTTLCTTLGNHDIRGNGRETYTMLYGPNYYSFDFADNHFIFLDSSPGWVEKEAISAEQYTWLESDLEKSKGKRIFVITHIPPADPRNGVSKNEIPNYVSDTNNDENWIEQELDNYSKSKSMNHGFQDPNEAKKFENLMSKYNVDTVYLSHIHSYFEYEKNGVRYLITGGAGAELLTKNSYYHYMVVKNGEVNTSTMVELPSPSNSYIPRYIATVKLFSNAMYDENPVAVFFIISGLVLLITLLIIKLYLWKKQHFTMFSRWICDIVKFAIKRFKEIFK